MNTNTRVFRILFIVTFGLAILLVIGGIVISRYAQREARKQLAALNITFSTMDINLLGRSVSIENLDWIHLDDSVVSAPHRLSIKNLEVSGISLYELIKNKNLKIRKVSLAEGNFQFNKFLKTKRKRSDTDNKNFVKAISIDAINLSSIQTTIVNDTIEEYSGSMDLFLKDVSIDDMRMGDIISSYKVKSFETSITNFIMNEKDAMYKTKISELYANSKDQKITIDSISLTPKYSKYRFSRKVGKQIDRFTLNIPQLSISGFEFHQLKDSIFRMEFIKIDHAKLHVYRDKRLPFIKDKNTPLPIAMIRSFPFELAIDSIGINEAKITYEEFPEEGFRTGQISFEHLNATIDHVSNRNHYPNYEQSTIKVKSRVMGKGTIEAEFSLPYGKKQIYNAKGVIKNLALYRLNPILESVAFISIESGNLKQLNFNFDYNDLRSDGSVLINYEDLKLTSLTKEKESTTNQFKSWVLNTFLKKDKDKSVSKEKRTGKIDFERERKRAIIHLWVKSLFSGLKSSVLDSPNKKKEK